MLCESHLHYSSDGGCNPKRLMARHMMLTHPTAILAMIAMVHLFFSFHNRPFSSDGASACAESYLADVHHPP
jgi:hypothetical protein